MQPAVLNSSESITLPNPPVPTLRVSSEQNNLEEKLDTDVKPDEEVPAAISLTRLSPEPNEPVSEAEPPNSTTHVRAYAKLQGNSWEYYIQKLAVVLGKGPDMGSSSSSSSGVDVFLGASDGVSKKHLRIEYNTHERQWELYCFGKAGVIVNGDRYEPFCHPVPLISRSVIIVEDVEFYFLLPAGSGSPDRQEDLSLRNNRRSRVRKASNESTTAKRRSTSHTEDLSAISDSEVPPADLAKPPLSYACLIAEAINSTEDQRLTLSGIYKYLSDKYPYFRYTKSGWQNSIRHNLSLNKAFRKVPRSMGEPGKGMFWIIDTNFKHLVETTGNGRRTIGRSKSLQPPGLSSAPTTPPLASRQNSAISTTNFVPILPTRPVSVTPMLAPQLLEAAAAMEILPSDKTEEETH